MSSETYKEDPDSRVANMELVLDEAEKQMVSGINTMVDSLIKPFVDCKDWSMIVGWNFDSLYGCFYRHNEMCESALDKTIAQTKEATRDDVGREVDLTNSILDGFRGESTWNHTYLPSDSYVHSTEPPVEYWGGIYLEKLTDDDSIIAIGHNIFGNYRTSFTNTGRVGSQLDRFTFGFTYDALLEWLEQISEDTREAEQDRLLDIGHPFYIFNYGDIVNVGGAEQEEMLDELDYEVRCTTTGSAENSDIDFLYYDIGD